MLRVVDNGDPIKKLYAAYLEARRTNQAFADSLRAALKEARRSIPSAQRPYDLKRRVSRALERFEGVRGVRGSRGHSKVSRLEIPKVIRLSPDLAPKIGA